MLSVTVICLLMSSNIFMCIRDYHQRMIILILLNDIWMWYIAKSLHICRDACSHINYKGNILDDIIIKMYSSSVQLTYSGVAIYRHTWVTRDSSNISMLSEYTLRQLQLSAYPQMNVPRNMLQNSICLALPQCLPDLWFYTNFILEISKLKKKKNLPFFYGE